MKITRVGVDLPKNVFQVHGVDEREKALLALHDEAFDIAYIDGSHSAVNVLMDAMLTWQLLKEGGMIIFDDYEWQHQKSPERRPKMAIDIFLRVLGHQMDVVHKAYQVIVKKRTRRAPASQRRPSARQQRRERYAGHHNVFRRL